MALNSLASVLRRVALCRVRFPSAVILMTTESHLDILETIGGKSERVFRRIEEVGPLSYKGEAED